MVILRTNLLALLVALASYQLASGAIVNFMGDLTSGGPGILGSIPGDVPKQSYFGSLTFDESFGTAIITGGSFKSAGRDFDVTDGFISVQDNGSNDNATIFANLSGSSTGLLALSLNGDAVSSELITTENLNRFFKQNTLPDPLTVSFDGGNGSYSGNASSVPEPGSGLILFSITLGMLFKRSRAYAD